LFQLGGAWPGKAGQGVVRLGMARHGGAGQGKAGIFLGGSVFEFQNSEVEKFYRGVQPIPVGEMITFQQLADVGFDVRNGGRRLIYAANRVLRENDRKMLINVRGVGYRMSAGKDQMEHAWGRRTRARRQIGKAVHEVTYIDTAKLTVDERKTLTDRENHLKQQLRLLRARNIAAQKVAKQAIVKVEKSVEIQQESLSRIDQLIAEAEKIRKQLRA
jgi:hypothetical protein